MNKRLLAAIEAVLATGNRDIYYEAPPTGEPDGFMDAVNDHQRALEELRAAHQVATTFQDRSCRPTRVYHDAEKERLRKDPALKAYHDANGFSQHDRERDIDSIARAKEDEKQ